MKLDPKIIDGKRPLTCFDVDEAEKYIGKLCYISDEYCRFRALELIEPTILKGVEDCEVPFHYDKNRQADFCIPCDWVAGEKKYRPYTIEEFCNEGFEIVVFRDKEHHDLEYHVRYNGYRKCDNVYKVILGNISYLLNDLFEDFEYLDSDGEWKPFGVEE